MCDLCICKFIFNQFPFCLRNEELSEVKVKRQMSLLRRDQKIVNLESRYIDDLPVHCKKCTTLSVAVK